MSAISRGQVLSVDLIFSTLVMVFIFFLVGTAWNNLQSSTAAELDRQETQSSAASALDFLMQSRGFPEDWQGPSGLGGGF